MSGGPEPPGATWTVLGAGTILPQVGLGAAGYALRPAPGAPVTLFDCGPGTLRALPEAGIALADVRRVVLSHFHPDHWLDLPALAFARRNPACEEPPELELIAPIGLNALLAGLAEAVERVGRGAWVSFERTRVREVVAPDRPGRIGTPEFELAHAPTRHTKTSLAWRVDLPSGSSVTYTGDALEVPAIIELARGTGLLVAECSFPDPADAAPATGHLSPSSAARLAEASGAKHLVLSHFYPAMDRGQARSVAARTYSGPISCARDGATFRLGEA